MSLRISVLTAALGLTILAAPAFAQQSSSVTQADVQRLQDNVYLADRDISQLRGRDAARASQLVTELDDLRDEVVYLKVKRRKEKTLRHLDASHSPLGERRVDGDGEQGGPDRFGDADARRDLSIDGTPGGGI